MGEKGAHLPIQWIMGVNILVTGVVLVFGGLLITRDIRAAHDLSSVYLKHSGVTATETEELVRIQMPLRKAVTGQKLLIERFAYEFELFVAREDGHIAALKAALVRMRAGCTDLEAIWPARLDRERLNRLRAMINMSVGIFEEATEFGRVGFGEMYRLAEESRDAVGLLIAEVNALELQMDEISQASAVRVAEKSVSTEANERILSELLRSVLAHHRTTLAAIFILVILFQFTFFFFFKKRLAFFSRVTRSVGDRKDLSRRVDLTSKDEFGHLAESFNTMLRNLQRAVDSEAFLSNIIESMNEMVIVLSPDGTIKTANESTAEKMGVQRESLAGASIFDFLEADDWSLHGMLAAKSRVDGAQGGVRAKTGERIPVLVSLAALDRRPDMPESDHIICTLADITVRVRYESEKIEAQKVAADQAKYALIGQVAGKMAHDFNNVLGVIMGNAEFSMLTCEDREVKETLRLIFEQSVRGKNLTRNLVAFAKSQEPKQVFFRIGHTVELVARLLQKDLKDVDFIFEDRTNNMELLADPGMIEHTLVNLIQNAVHATATAESPRITVRAYRTRMSACLEVADNGCGIPEEYQSCVFDPSFTLKGSKDADNVYPADIKGTGYGMANVKKYVEQHKGDVLLESEFGTGTRVTVRLPLIKKGISEKDKRELKQGRLYQGKHILLVEDEKDISDLYRRILTQPPFSHRVDIAASGEKAMALLAENRYDCLSLDYILAGKMNGMEIYQTVRKTDKTLPILFLSGNIEFLESIKQLRRSDPYVDHLSKPCQSRDYIDGINRLFEASEAAETQG